MTRKHFKMFAEIVAKVQNPIERKEAARQIANVCAKCNPRFDFQRFYAACNCSR